MARWSDVAEYLQPHVESLNPQSMAAHGWVSGTTKRIDVVIASADKGMLHRWYPERGTGGWHPRWERHGGAFASRAALANSRSDTLMAFALNLQGDLVLAGDFGGDLDAVDVGDWPSENLGHPSRDRLVSHPAAVTDGDTVRVYATAETGTIWALAVDHNGNRTQDWHQAYRENLPRRAGRHWAYAPAASSWAPGRLDLFAVDDGTDPTSFDNTLAHAWHDGNSRSPEWETLGIGGLSSSPDTAVWPITPDHSLGVVHVMACGSVEDLQGPSFAFASWLGRHWAYRWIHPRGATADGTVASWGRPRLDVFYLKDTFTRRSDGSERFVSGHAWYDGGRWGTAESGWAFTDGDFEAPYPVAPWNGRPL